jgi:RNA polymerase sigma-70 factor (ECF subfamily)
MKQALVLVEDVRPDEELVVEAQGGSDAAYAALVRRHMAAAYRVGLRITANRSDAEEVLQNTFVQMHRRLGGFRGEAPFARWIHAVATNAALMVLRERRRHAAESLEVSLALDEHGTWRRLDVDLSTAARADEIVERRELAEVALEALAELPDAYRAPFVLRDLEGLSTDDTAAALGITGELVRQRVHRARLALRARLTSLVGGDA